MRKPRAGEGGAWTPRRLFAGISGWCSASRSSPQETAAEPAHAATCIGIGAGRYERNRRPISSKPSRPLNRSAAACAVFLPSRAPFVHAAAAVFDGRARFGFCSDSGAGPRRSRRRSPPSARDVPARTAPTRCRARPGSHARSARAESARDRRPSAATAPPTTPPTRSAPPPPSPAAPRQPAPADSPDYRPSARQVRRQTLTGGETHPRALPAREPPTSRQRLERIGLQPLGESLQDAPLNRRHLLGNPSKRAVGQNEHLRLRCCGNGCCSRGSGDQRDLTEKVAATEPVNRATVLLHHRRTLDNDNELTTGRALSCQHRSFGKDHLVGLQCKRGKFSLCATRKERDALDQLDLRVLMKTHRAPIIPHPHQTSHTNAG